MGDRSGARRHRHGPECGHTGIQHDDHVDYLVEGQLEPAAGMEHVLPVDDAHPVQCTPAHDCYGHGPNHTHGPGCGHEQVPHGDHLDYLVDGHLHHPHGKHCDNHGEVALVGARGEVAVELCR